MMQHEDAGGERHHRAHDVLDQQDGHPGRAIELAQDGDHLVGLGRPQPGHDFIEQQQFRPCRERAGELEALAVRQRQRGGRLAQFCEQIELPDHLVRRLQRFLHVFGVQQRSDDDVVLDRERRERPYVLKGAADAAPGDLVRAPAVDPLARERDGALVGTQHAGHHAEQRGLAGAVGADHGEDLPGQDFAADAVDRAQSAEAFAHALDRQQRGHGPLLRIPSTPASHGHTPFGRNQMMTISASP